MWREKQTACRWVSVGVGGGGKGPHSSAPSTGRPELCLFLPTLPFGVWLWGLP